MQSADNAVKEMPEPILVAFDRPEKQILVQAYLIPEFKIPYKKDGLPSVP